MTDLIAKAIFSPTLHIYSNEMPAKVGRMVLQMGQHLCGFNSCAC